MQFEYEITAEDYVACQVLYNKMINDAKRIRERALGWIALGLLLILAASSAPSVNWAPVLLALFGAMWIYGGFRMLFPARYLRGHYPGTKLEGKKFNAVINEEGVQIAGKFAKWDVRWDGVTLKAKNKKVFILHSDAAATIFMFGKQYLSEEQQHEMRRLAAIQTTIK